MQGNIQFEGGNNYGPTAGIEGQSINIQGDIQLLGFM
jgi:hypothetical protein